MFLVVLKGLVHEKLLRHKHIDLERTFAVEMRIERKESKSEQTQI